MLFNKEIKLKAYTTDKTVYDFAKPIYKPPTPNWLKNLCPVKHIDPLTELPVVIPTAQTCPGIRDYLRKAIVLPAWYDFHIIVRPNGTYDISGKQFNEIATTHPLFQLGSEFVKDDNLILLKLSSPWNLSCDEDVEFLYGPAFYNSSFFIENDVLVPPGIVNFKHQHSTNIHLTLKVRKETYRIDVKMGTPLVSLVPITDRNIKIEHKLFSNPAEMMENLSSFPKVEIGKYYKKLQMLKK